MLLWRLTTHPGLDGFGGTQASGRWHHRPRRVVYAAEHPALAVLEALAHLNLAQHEIPRTLKLVRIEAAAGASLSAAGELPSGWQSAVETSRAVGDAWLARGATLLMQVPSALLPHSANWLINLVHPEAATHLTESHEGYWFDDRLLRFTPGAGRE